MKARNILLSLLLIVAGLQMANAQKVILYKRGGQTVECKVAVLDSVVFVEKKAPVITHRDYVDLGLPSGTLWATCNIGADTPEAYGDYFAWGETEGYNDGKTSFTWGTYDWCNGSSNTMTKYCTNGSYGIVDSKTELESDDDAATANWGDDWQMPSYAQILELVNSEYTTTSWTTQNGVNGGMIVSKKNGNRIFLPAAGFRDNASLMADGVVGNYLTRSLSANPGNAYILQVFSMSIQWLTYSRSYGQSVRPVRKQ